MVRDARRNPDLVLIGAWLGLVVFVGFGRTDFTGDGLRHLPLLLNRRGPRLGEPRWLLFPSLLFVLLKPLVLVGLARNVESLIRPMMLATVVFATGYLWLIRSCLVSLGISADRRAAALSLAAFSAALFLVATDLMEPIFGAAFAAGGLALIARRCANDADPNRQRRAMLAGTALIALAALIYQGLVLAVGFMPLFAPKATLRKPRTLVQAAAIVALVPLTMTLLLVISGNSLPHALARITQGEENPLYRSFQKPSGRMPYLVTILAGPPQGVVVLPGFHGFRGVLDMLRRSGERVNVLEIMFRLCMGGAIIWAGLIAAWRRRDLSLLAASAVLVVLPLVRHQQYGYIKFYILLPVLLAIGASRARRLILPVGAAAILLVLNVVPAVANIPAARRAYRTRIAEYSRADEKSCWITTGWEPSFPFLWPGRVCGVLGSLAAGSGENDLLIVKGAHERLTNCVRDCMCRASSVFTDDMLYQNRRLVVESTGHFAYDDLDLTKELLPADAMIRMSSPDAPAPVYRYGPDQQRRMCGLVEPHRIPDP